MPLDTTQILGTAAFQTSSNDYLQRIHGMVGMYNALPLGDTIRRIEALDTIMMITGDYLTSKRPTATVKNTARWDALTNLADQCYLEIQNLGAKMVSGPSDYRSIDGRHRSYWLERLDPLHRPGFVLAPLYATWLGGGMGDFWTSIGRLGIGQVRDHDTLMPTSTKPAQVKLLGQDQTPKRNKYKATINEMGSLRDFWDQPKTTVGMHTAYGGRDWGIFVLSPDGQLYVNSHKVGRFHHSTFLGGAPVAAAGEMVVGFDGHILLITNKTGHYMAAVEEMRRMVSRLAIPDNTIILPNLVKALNPPRVAEFYRVKEFRENGEAGVKLKAATVKLHVPSWARSSAAVQQLISRIP